MIWARGYLLIQLTAEEAPSWNALGRHSFVEERRRNAQLRGSQTPRLEHSVLCGPIEYNYVTVHSAVHL